MEGKINKYICRWLLGLGGWNIKLEKTEKAEGYFGFILKDLFSSRQTDTYHFIA